MIDTTARIHLPRPIAFAFSGGTSLGATQVGMVRALHAHGIVPDLVVGSSVGAVNAAFLAGGWRAERIAALASIWSHLRAEDVFGPSGLPRYLRVLRGGASVAAPASLRRLLERHLPERHADLAIPAAVVATDLLSGAPVILDAGDLRQNVMASAAIPGVFPSVEIGGRRLADGGIAAHVPVVQAAELGAASVVVLDTGYPCTASELPHGIIPNVVHVVNLVLRHQSQVALSIVGERSPVVYLPSPCPMGVAPYDFTQSAALVEKGHEATSRFLETLRVHGPGVYGHPHLPDAGEATEAAPREAIVAPAA